jgi:Tfp pilus assembly protein PilN
MVNINLLPWREEELKYRKKVIRKMLSLAILLVVVINLIIHQLISRHQHAVRERIVAMNKTVDHVNQINGVGSTHSKSSVSLSDSDSLQKLFSVLGKNQAKKVCFTSIESREQSMFFIGKAKSVNDLTEFLLHWDAANLFAAIRIREMEQSEDGTVRFSYEAQT